MSHKHGMENKKKIVSTLANSFAEDTTLHGVKNFSKAGIPLWRRIVWLIVIAGMMTFSIYAIVLAVSSFLQYNTVTSVYQIFHDKIEFPALHICNINVERRNALIEYYPELEGFHNSHFDPLRPTLNSTLMERLKNVSAMQFYTDIGFSMDEMFVSCFVDGFWGSINCSDYIKPHFYYGLCYTFNSYEVIKDRGHKFMHQSGVIDSISLVLNVAPDEYTSYAYGAGHGFIISVYDPDYVWPDENNQFAVSLGTNTMVAVEKHTRKIRSKPYAEESCVKDGPKKMSNSACISRCLYQRSFTFLPNCTCDVHATTGDTQCTLYDYYFCSESFHEIDRAEEIRKCNCKQLCAETYYKYYVSSTDFPNSGLVEVAQYENWPHQNMSDIKNNYASVQIFFRSLTETVTEEKPEMSSIQLIGNIGGSLGLCVGASLITIVEVFELLWICCSKLLSKRTTGPQ